MIILRQKNLLTRQEVMLFKDWAGPKRPEFRQDIPMQQLTGNQKWQLWCAELFLNMIDTHKS